MTKQSLATRITLLVGAAVVFTACQQEPERELELAPASVLPGFVQTAPPVWEEPLAYAGDDRGARHGGPAGA